VNHHPIQPLAKDEHGHVRFKQNKIIVHLFETGKLDLNSLFEFPKEDRQQIKQLLGVSLSHYGECVNFGVDDDAYNAAHAYYDEGTINSYEARILALESEISWIRSELRGPIARLYGVHEDDLKGK
jgi:hypothetical protein